MVRFEKQHSSLLFFCGVMICFFANCFLHAIRFLSHKVYGYLVNYQVDRHFSFALYRLFLYWMA